MNFQNFTRAFIISAAILGVQASHAMEAEHERARISSLPQPAKIDHALKADLRKDIMAFHDGLSNFCVVGTALKALDSPSKSGGISAQIGFNKLDVRDSSENLTVDCSIKFGFQSNVGGATNSLKKTFIFTASQSYGVEKREYAEEAWAVLKTAVLKNLLDTLKQPDSSPQKA